MTSTLENMYTAAVLVIGRTLHRVTFTKSGEFIKGEYGGTTTPRKVLVQNVEDANLVSSLLDNGNHAPAIDLDFPIHAIPSSTPGHYHLYLELELPWKSYEKLLKVMAEIGVIEKGFYESAKHFKQTFLRLPHIKKDTNAPTFK
jgi:hypothetical protein